jgi:hypothetical protein
MIPGADAVERNEDRQDRHRQVVVDDVVLAALLLRRSGQRELGL